MKLDKNVPELLKLGNLKCSEILDLGILDFQILWFYRLLEHIRLEVSVDYKKCEHSDALEIYRFHALWIRVIAGYFGVSKVLQNTDGWILMI